MIVKKTILVSVFVLFCHMFSMKAAEDLDQNDREIVAKLFIVVLKCFKNADWGACTEMINNNYDITQPKYKQCTCHMACAGEELGVINSKGESEPAKFLEYVNRINNATIKGQLKNVYDKCNNVKGAEKCDLSEKFFICVKSASPVLKERMSALAEALMKMKQN